MDKELHQKILKYLAGKEISAQQIADGIKHSDYPSRVVQALNELRTLGSVECEKRKGKGNTLIYWVSASAPEEATPSTDDLVKKHAEQMTAMYDRALKAEEALGRIAETVMHIEGAGVEAKVKKACVSLMSAESQREAWREMASMYGHETPLDLAGYIGELINASKRVEKQKPTAAKQSTPRRPFGVTGLVGYHAATGKVTLFLNRRLSAKSITLDAEKLQQLADMAR